MFLYSFANNSNPNYPSLAISEHTEYTETEDNETEYTEDYTEEDEDYSDEESEGESADVNELLDEVMDDTISTETESDIPVPVPRQSIHREAQSYHTVYII